LIFPLRQHGGRARDDDLSHPAAQQQLARDQPALNGLTEANVVGNK
jgi:hypothetical protein